MVNPAVPMPQLPKVLLQKMHLALFSNESPSTAQGQQQSVQLDWLVIIDWVYANFFAAAVQFQNQDQFWISRTAISLVRFSPNVYLK